MEEKLTHMERLSSSTGRRKQQISGAYWPTSLAEPSQWVLDQQKTLFQMVDGAWGTAPKVQAEHTHGKGNKILNDITYRGRKILIKIRNDVNPSRGVGQIDRHHICTSDYCSSQLSELATCIHRQTLLAEGKSQILGTQIRGKGANIQMFWAWIQWRLWLSLLFLRISPLAWRYKLMYASQYIKAI